MNESYFWRRLWLTLIVVLFLLSVSACMDTNAMPKAWIDYPSDGSSLAKGLSVTVISHAYAREGVAEVMLSVNGEPYRRDPPLEPGASFSEVRQEWVPVEAGEYVLQVWTYDSAGETGNPDSVTVFVAVEEVEIPEEVVTVISSTVVSPTVITLTPTQTVTGTQIPPTETPTPTITATAPPTLTWTNTFVPPTNTPTATDVPPDNSPPPVPVPDDPSNGAVVPCQASQTLTWNAVSDPSGIAGYYVKLEQQLTADSWQSAGGWGPLSATDVDVTVNCGLVYRWMVRAEDNEGNISAWSSASQFGVNLE